MLALQVYSYFPKSNVFLRLYNLVYPTSRFKSIMQSRHPIFTLCNSLSLQIRLRCTLPSVSLSRNRFRSGTQRMAFQTSAIRQTKLTSYPSSPFDFVIVESLRREQRRRCLGTSHAAIESNIETLSISELWSRILYTHSKRAASMEEMKPLRRTFEQTNERRTGSSTMVAPPCTFIAITTIWY